MPTNYKVVFREENGAGNGNPLKWELGSPLALSAIQISRNTETVESFLQVKALNISGKMVGEVHAEAEVQYSDGSFETLSLDDLDADIESGAEYVFDAAKLSRGDATRADVTTTRIRFIDGTVWESKGQPIDIVLGNPIDFPANLSKARMAYLTNAGCKNVVSATHAVNDQGTYWVCTCGQVNLSDTCAKCKLDKQTAFNSENAAFLEKQANSTKKTGRCVLIVAAALLVAAIALFIVTQVPGFKEALPDVAGIGDIVAPNKGVYVVSRHSYVNYEGEDALAEYEYDEHGNCVKSITLKPELTSYTCKFDDYGNRIEMSGGDYTYKTTINDVDEYGQPTKMTEIVRGDDSTSTYVFDITWYGEGHVKQATQIDYFEYSTFTTTSYFNESGERTRYEAMFDYSGTSLEGVLDNSLYYTDYAYEHDAEGRVVSVTASDSDGETFTQEFEYDDNGNVIRIIEDGEVIDEYEYVFIQDLSPAVIMRNNHFMEECGF